MEEVIGIGEPIGRLRVDELQAGLPGGADAELVAGDPHRVVVAGQHDIDRAAAAGRQMEIADGYDQVGLGRRGKKREDRQKNEGQKDGVGKMEKEIAKARKDENAKYGRNRIMRGNQIAQASSRFRSFGFSRFVFSRVYLSVHHVSVFRGAQPLIAWVAKGADREESGRLVRKTPGPRLPGGEKDGDVGRNAASYGDGRIRNQKVKKIAVILFRFSAVVNHREG
jgi:hypothetical protein